MIELDEIPVCGQAVYHHLLLGTQYGKYVVEFLHAAHSEWVEVEFEEVVAVLVHAYVERGVYGMGGECLVVGESQDVVSVTHVVGVHLVRVVRTFVDAFVHPGMGMQTCPFPAGGGIKISVGAVDFVSAERYRALEPVYRGDTECREPGDDSQEPENPDTPVNPAETTVFLNEAMSSPAGDDEDFIELYNASDSEADISGFILQDDKGEEEEFVIPDGTVIPAKGFIAFTKDEAGSFTFGLGAGGDKVTLLDSGRNILDSVELPDFGDTEGSSYARTEDGAGEWAITENPTKGASNNN